MTAILKLKLARSGSLGTEVISAGLVVFTDLKKLPAFKFSQPGKLKR